MALLIFHSLFARNYYDQTPAITSEKHSPLREEIISI